MDLKTVRFGTALIAMALVANCAAENEALRSGVIALCANSSVCPHSIEYISTHDRPLAAASFGVASDGTAELAAVQGALSEAIKSRHALSFSKGTTRFSGAVVTAPVSLLGQGMETVLKGDGSWDKPIAQGGAGDKTTRTIIYKDFASGDGQFSIQNMQIDGGDGGYQGDAILQISKGVGVVAPRPFLKSLAFANTETKSTDGGVNLLNLAGVNGAVGTDLTFKNFSKAALNWTGGSENGFFSRLIFEGGTTGFARAPGLQINNAAKAVFINARAWNLEGHGALIDCDANGMACDSISLIEWDIENTGLGTGGGPGSGSGVTAKGAATNRAKKLLLSDIRIKNSGVNVASNGVFIRYFDDVTLNDVSVDAATQSGFYFRDATRIIADGLTANNVTQNLFVFQNVQDFTFRDLAGKTAGHYGLNFLGANARLHIEAEALRGARRGPIFFGGGATFPTDSYVAFFDEQSTTSASNTAMFDIPVAPGQVLMIEVDVTAKGTTNRRDSTDWAFVRHNGNTAVIESSGHTKEFETEASMDGRFTSPNPGVVRFMVRGIARETIVWTAQIRIWSVG